ncbi:MAG: hypothetical protein A2103_01895 [Gammaproteobacteria bacterium GWF2_41_13]|nr:MAG: hypothetical protein A2103_01895 [Gammaproteobacteria bacterium GWF2_41_13]
MMPQYSVAQGILDELRKYKNYLRPKVGESICQLADRNPPGEQSALEEISNRVVSHIRDESEQKAACKYFFAVWLERSVIFLGERLTYEGMQQLLETEVNLLGKPYRVEDFLAVRRERHFLESEAKKAEGQKCMENIRQMMLSLPHAASLSLDTDKSSSGAPSSVSSETPAASSCLLEDSEHYDSLIPSKEELAQETQSAGFPFWPPSAGASSQIPMSQEEETQLSHRLRDLPSEIGEQVECRVRDMTAAMRARTLQDGRSWEACVDEALRTTKSGLRRR